MPTHGVGCTYSYLRLTRASLTMSYSSTLFVFMNILVRNCPDNLYLIYMKKVNYLLVLAFLMVLMNTNCKKDENESNSVETSLRISKIADNQAMENPFYTFEYDTKNLLVRISSENQYSSQYEDIVYNTNKQPIKVTHTDYYLGSIESSWISNIEWTTKGFTVTDNNVYNEINIFELDSHGRIAKKTNIFKPQFSEVDTTIIEYNWFGDDSLRLSKNTERYQFEKKNHPFSVINLAIIQATSIGYAEWSETQNTIVTKKYHETSFDAEATYTYNDKNYPLKVDIKYTSSEGISHDYVYFEYESF